jgi:hypothetical protein
MTLTLHTPNDLVAVAWIATIPGLTADGVATQLPSDETTWAAHGFVVVPLSVGGSPHSYVPVRQPVMQVECWATVPDSDKLPWWKANQLAEQIRFATYDRVTFGRALSISAGTVAYPGAAVKSAQMMTEPRRIWSDQGDYAGYTFDLRLNWIQVGETIA